MKGALGKLKVLPLTPDLWPAMEDLFGNQGPCSRCWRMYWRKGAAYRREPPERNKGAFRDLVLNGPPPGLLGFDDDLSVGSCQLTPRDALPWLNRVAELKGTDDIPVWAITCFYIRKGYRRRGVTSALIEAWMASDAKIEQQLPRLPQVSLMSMYRR